MLEVLAHYIIQIIETTRYIGIFILMALESALIPIPSEVTMPFAGFLASKGELSLIPIILVGTFANLVGSLIAYYVGYFLEETVMLRLIRRYGKFFLLSEHDYHKSEHWFKKYGDKIIFISRLLPAVRTVISLPAGMFGMDIKKFVIYTTLGCLIWSAILAYVGFVLGENWNAMEPIYRKFEFLIIGIIIVGIIVYIERHVGLRKKFFKSGKK